jgi:4-hydroxy-2-oxoglutarate aldolase
MYDESLFGAYAPITTPFDADREIAYDRLVDNVFKWAQTRLTGLVVLGSNGEGVFLTDPERRKVWETVRAVLPAEKKIIAGTGCESTYATAKLNEVAAEAGADAALVITPHYYRSKMDGPAMVRHYTALAEQSALPLFIYNMPGNTGIDLSPDITLEIAQHPNVIGVKDSSGNVVKMGTIIPLAPSHFRVYAGSASFLYPAVALGAVGGVMALANLAPDLCADLYEYASTGKHDEARELQLRLIPLNTAVTSGFGIPALKQGLDWLGFYGGPVRSPLGELNDAQKATLRELMVAIKLLDA